MTPDEMRARSLDYAKGNRSASRIGPKIKNRNTNGNRRPKKAKPNAPPKTDERYNDHIGSVKWTKFRKEVLQLRGNRCERCKSEHHLQVHHLHYRNFGRELPEDVQVICKNCHDRIHGHKTYGKSGKTAFDQLLGL